MQKQKEVELEIEATELYKNAREFQKYLYYLKWGKDKNNPFSKDHLPNSARAIMMLVTDYLSGAKTKRKGIAEIKQEMARMKTNIYTSFDKEIITREAFSEILIYFAKLKRALENTCPPANKKTKSVKPVL